MIRLASILATAVLLFAWGQPASGQCPNCPSGGCRIAPAIAPAPGGVVANDNGKTYYKHPDGVFRETPFVQVGGAKLCDCCKPQCTCEPGNKNPDCVCYPCKCHPTAAPAFFTDTHGNTYTLIGGTYWQTGPGVLGTTPQTFRLQPTCPNCPR